MSQDRKIIQIVSMSDHDGMFVDLDACDTEAYAGSGQDGPSRLAG